MTRIGSAFAINTYSYTQTMTAAACLRHLASQGVRRVELMLFPGHFWIDADRNTLSELRGILRDEGMELASLNTTNIDLNIAGAAPEMRAFSLDMVEAFVRLTGELEAPGFILGPGKANPLHPLPFERLRDHFFSALDRLRIADASGTALWVENMPFAFLPDVGRLETTLADYGANEIGVCYDITNAHFTGEDPALGLARIAPRLKLVHVSDTFRTIYRHDPIGVGDVDFAGAFEAMRRIGFADAPVLEIISPTPDRDFAEAPALLAERSRL